MEHRAAPQRAPRRTGRPSRPPLTEEDIARAALAIIDERGWAACTMARLAERLGVRAPSLYHHVDGQRGVIELVRGLIVREITDAADLSLPWRAGIQSFGVAYYRAFSRHPNAIQVLSTTPVRNAETLRMYEAFLGMLVRDGWEVASAFEALIGLEYLALGFAYDWNAEDVLLDHELIAGRRLPLLAEVTRGQREQRVVAESTFLSLLSHYGEMFLGPEERGAG
ncbi:TetR/AcrR family transcriptional regulator [Leucobacter massiliensis]|uniref:TetR/AcrR family transcriptional regulator n=1 Tax=Leucobacter massiliensis TaxID=1686285 RepID=UPI0015E28087|nr:TetR family transcriptional regulator [Leucobacter massiliensis]